MMNRLKLVIVVIVSLILQATLFSRIGILSVHANLAIPLIVGLSMGFGPYIGGFSGLIIGLVQDVLFTNVLGVSALTYFVIGFIIGNSEAGINREDIRSGLILTFIATIGNFLGISIIGKIIGDNISIISFLLGPIFVELILNCILYVVVYYLFKKIFVFPRFRL